MLLLCQLSLPKADLLAQAEAMVMSVSVYLKHLTVLACFQGSDGRPTQCGCATLQSKPVKRQLKEADSETVPNVWENSSYLEKRKGNPDHVGLAPAPNISPPFSQQWGLAHLPAACQRSRASTPYAFPPKLARGRGA